MIIVVKYALKYLVLIFFWWGYLVLILMLWKNAFSFFFLVFRVLIQRDVSGKCKKIKIALSQLSGCCAVLIFLHIFS